MSSGWRGAVVVSLGSALGGCSRFLLGLALAGLSSDELPIGTLAANLLGALLIGAYAARSRALRAEARMTDLFVMTGFCGGFTTFSIFSVEIVSLAAISPGLALFWLALSVTTWIVGIGLGDLLGRTLTASSKTAEWGPRESD